MRRAFTLPEEDVAHLESLGLPWETVVDAGSQWLLIERFPFPPGYNVGAGAVAIQIPAGYATAPLDMAYFLPHLSRLDGGAIRQAQVQQMIESCPWQRWSRHYPWVAGEHNLGTHLTLISRWLNAALL
jgi:Prokaryotic E2 family E